MRLDVEGGTEAAIRHLLELGHRRIGHVASVHDRPDVQGRAGAPSTGSSGATSPRVHDRLRRSTPARDGRARAADARTRTLTAVFCDDDVIAAGAYLAARELGRRIPDDLSVVGFDGLDIGRVLDPPLTTVVADAAELGRVAFELLHGAARRQAAAQPRACRWQLEVRGSTAPPGLSPCRIQSYVVPSYV